MKITVFLEGSPGHEKQSLAIVSALKKLTDVEMECIHLPKKSMAGRVEELMRYFCLPDGGCMYDVTGSDILLGTGSRTHAALLSCKKKYSIPVVTCMAPDLLLRNKFDLCFVPRHDDISESSGIFLTDGPPVYQTKAPENVETRKNNGLILVGGVDPASHIWNEFEIVNSIECLIRAHAQMTWVVSSSPRTPESTVDLMRTLEESNDNVHFYHFRDTPKGWVEEQYALSDRCWVTADSISMIYEALAAGCRVGTIPVQWKKKNDKFQRSLQHLQERGLVVPIERAVEMDSTPLAGVYFDEAARCAKELLLRFG